MDRTNPIMLPRYGVDQSTGPINFQEAEDAYLAAM
jgi:hypothetical protein